jgi:hypothetical protein
MTVIESRTGPVGIPISGVYTQLERQKRHEHAVAQTLRWAREAAADEDFGEALSWLAVVEAIDGTLAPGWEQTQASWRRFSSERGFRPPPGPPI